MGTHLRVFSESYSMNTNKIGFKKSLRPCSLDEISKGWSMSVFPSPFRPIVRSCLFENIPYAGGG